MHKLITTFVLMFASVFLAAKADGQPSPPQNAATWYQQALDKLAAFREQSKDDFDTLMNYDSSKPPTATERAALARVQPILDLARQGSTLPQCDFNLNRNDGFEMLMPHLGGLRHVAKMLNVDAHLKMYEGNHTGMANAIADMARISGHFDSDDTLISTLVGTAIFSLSDKSIETAMDRGTLGPEESQKLLEALAPLNPDDPFDYVGAVKGERKMGYEWLADKFDENEPMEFANYLNSIVGGGGNEDALLALGLSTPESIDAALDAYGSGLDRMINIFQMEDQTAAMAAMGELEGEISSGALGPLARLMMPAMGKALEHKFRSEKMLADRKSLLTALANGSKSPQELANAAVWYVRGVEMLEASDAKSLESLRAFAADVSQKTPREVADALASKEWQDILNVFRDGSMMGRCDFKIAREQWWQNRIGFLPNYIAGMHDAFRLMHADAVRLLSAGDARGAIDRLSVAFRVSAHLGHDPVMVSALVSHCNFARTLELTERAFQQHLINQDAKPVLLEAVKKMRGGDPCGLVNAAISTRDELAKFLGRFARHKDGSFDTVRRDRILADIRALDADQVLYVMIMRFTLQENAIDAARAQNNAPTEAGQTAQVLKRLEDVLSQRDLSAIYRDIPNHGPELANHEYAFVREQSIPAVAHSGDGRYGLNYSNHVRRAKQHLVRAYEIFGADAETKRSLVSE